MLAPFPWASDHTVLHCPQDAIAIDLPGPEESIGDQDVISTQDHAEVARAMPLDVQSLTC